MIIDIKLNETMETIHSDMVIQKDYEIWQYLYMYPKPCSRYTNGPRNTITYLLWKSYMLKDYKSWKNAI